MRHMMIAVAVLLASLNASVAVAQERSLSLESVEGLRVHNVVAAAATHKGKRGVRVVVDTTRIRGDSQANLETLAIISGVEFSNGTIEIEVSGAPGPGAATGARGFVGLAFRVQDIYATCAHLQAMGYTISRPPRDGHMAFVRSPDLASVELLQDGRLPPAEPWKSMPNIGVW